MDTEEQAAVSRRDLMRAAAGAGVAGAAAATSGTAGAQEEDATFGMGAIVYEPDELTVTPGTTVTWENTSSAAHSVTAYEDEIPDDAEYFASGGFDSESAARNGWPDEGRLEPGDTFEHTFEVTGEHNFFCIPHEAAGMLGTVVVEEEGAGGEGSGIPQLPESAKTLMIATVAAMSATLAVAYFFLKYGGRTDPTAE